VSDIVDNRREKLVDTSHYYPRIGFQYPFTELYVSIEVGYNDKRGPRRGLKNLDLVSGGLPLQQQRLRLLY
jgi:hypothetical protein